jgi:hypothetical protein
MAFTAYATLTLGGALTAAVVGFIAGRCARRLPFVDDKLPWTIHRSGNTWIDSQQTCPTSSQQEGPTWPLSSP